MRPLPTLVLGILAIAAELGAQQAPDGFAKVDHEIEIGMLPGRLRFDVEKFSVAPGSKVKLVLSNNDEMQHNLVICEKGDGVLPKVIAAALALGGDASAKHFVPEIDEVLWHTKAILPEQSDTIWFRAPKAKGAYPFVCTLPGHTFTMKGVMHVGAAPKAFLGDVRYEVFEGQFKQLSELKMQKPVQRGVQRGGLIDISRHGRNQNYGVWYHAPLQLAQSGKYTVFLRCDDGGRVRIDGTTVVAHDGIHGAGKERKGQLELGAGAHELWIEYFQGGGGKVLDVAIAGPGLKRRSLTKKGGRGRPGGVPITVLDEPVVMRVHVENASARGIAIGMPGGMNCVFDAVTCKVQFGWAGAFLDVGPDRLGRGGRPCKILGQRFEVGGAAFAMRSGGADVKVRFRGYRTKPWPTIEFDWNGKPATFAVRPAMSGVGLRYEYAVAGLNEPVELAFGAGVAVTSSAGEFQKGVLRIPAARAAKFDLVVKPAGGNR